MRALFAALAEELAAGRGAVVVTVVASRGSTPRGPGARMLVRVGGTALGTGWPGTSAGRGGASAAPTG